MKTILVIIAALAALELIAWSAYPPTMPRGPLPGGGFKPAPPCRGIPKRAGEIIATAYETERTPGLDGYAAPIHGEIAINGRCYSFVSGGRGRGSIPFGLYRVSGPVKRPYLNPNAGNTAYRLSDAFDPITGDTRDALFIHPGRRTKGCIGIDPDQWAGFERDMEAARPRVLNLVAGRA